MGLSRARGGLLAVSLAAATARKSQRQSKKEPSAVNLSRQKPIPQAPPPPLLAVWTRPQNSHPSLTRETLSPKLRSVEAPNREVIFQRPFTIVIIFTHKRFKPGK